MFINRLLPAMLFGLLLMTASCDKANKEFVSGESIIKLDALNDLTNLYADGNTIIQFKAKLPRGNATDTRDVIFTLSDSNEGRFIGISANNKQTVRANTDGEATCAVRVGVVPGDYFISAEVAISGTTYRSSDIPVKLKSIAASDKIQLVASNLSPVADGNSMINLNITSTFSQDKKVTLTSNLGTFAGSTDPKTIAITLDDQGKASILYRLTNEAVVNIITARITEGAQATILVNPLLSYADTILVEPSALRVDTAGGSIQLTAALKKFNTNLKVSKGQPVFFTAYQLINGVPQTAGRFTGANNAVSDADGNIPAVRFFADTGNFNRQLPIVIDVSAFKSPTDKVHSIVQVRLI